MDVNAIMLENKKIRLGESSTTPNKVIIEVSLPQEEDIDETIGEIITNTNKPIATSNVVSKTVEVTIEEE
jgi:hypothetical protein